MRHHRLEEAIRDYILTKDSQRSDAGLKSGLGQFCEFMQSYVFPSCTLSVESVKQQHLEGFKLSLEARALSPSTINTRMTQVWSFLTWAGAQWQSVQLGVLPGLKLPLVTRPKQRRKWAMQDDELRRVSDYILIHMANNRMRDVFSNYIGFTVETGLRVEEVLRLVPSDFKSLEPGEAGLWVPGTKTEGSNVYIPITDDAAAFAYSAMVEARGAYLEAHPLARNLPTDYRLFDIPYHTLRRMWEEVRAHLGLADNPTATLKGLRRTFAYRCLRKGLPPRLLQELMRHASYSTTLEYLELFGLADNPETRALMNKPLGRV
jgi:integrase